MAPLLDSDELALRLRKPTSTILTQPTHYTEGTGGWSGIGSGHGGMGGAGIGPGGISGSGSGMGGSGPGMGGGGQKDLISKKID